VDTSFYTVSANAAEFINTAHKYGTKAMVSMLHDSNAVAMRTCTNSSHIDQFVSVIANYINQYGYDGFDIDWEDGIINSQYQQWIISLRAALPGKVLTVATTWNQRNVLARVQDKVDQINVMNYDSDIWPPRGPRALTSTAYNSALYQGANSDWTTADIYIYYNATSAGISRSKLGMGMPFYARVKRGCRYGYSIGSTCTQGVTDPGQPYASGNAATNARVPISYSDLVNSDYWTKGTRIWDSVHGAQYIRYEVSDSSQDAFVSYTGVEQMQEAARYVRNNSLGGIMTYDLTNEFITGETGDNRYPLSSAMYQMMVGGSTLQAAMQPE
jgi:GH18 family chitinase